MCALARPGMRIVGYGFYQGQGSYLSDWWNRSDRTEDTHTKTLPLPCVSTAFMAKTLPLPCVFHCLHD